MEASHEIYGSRLFVSWNCQMRGNLLIILICVVTPALSSTFSVPVNGSVTLPCTSEANYPTWYGPQLDGITDTPIPYSNAIGAFNSKLGEKRDRLSWDTNNKNLIISYVKRSDQGQYICREYIHNLEIRVAPQNPVISNTESVSPDKLIIRATQGLSHTLICTSTGGYPEPTVEWYRGSTTTSPLTSSKSTVHNTASDTYTVTQSCTIIPGSSDDGIQYYCQSKYDTEPTLQSSTSAELYLNLNPSIPTVSQLPTRVEGNTLQDIARCESSGFRPSTSLSLSWIFRGQTEVDTVTPTEDPASSAKFSVTSTYNKQVGRQDNGKQLTCSVNHSTLSSPVNGSTTVIVFYPPLTVTLSGDANVIANGVNKISLTCTGSEANPVSSITWKSGNTIITSDKQISNPAGSYNGQSTIQELSITPTRDMDGEQYKCEVKNNVSQTLTSQSKTLNLSYSPLVTLTGPASNYITEGDNNLLSCSVNSKPTSTITWYHNNIQVSQAKPGNNSLGYRLNPSARTHYGVYRCTANNAINPENEKQISITVKFKPLTTTISGNNNIIANGQNSLSLICTSGESNPVSDITWTINSVTTTSTSSLADQSGQYGGKKRRQKLTLKPTRDNDGDRVTCEARNDYSLATPATITATLDLKFSPQIQTMQDIIVVEGNYSILHCEASSKPVSTFKWFKNGQGSVIHQGVGTNGSNRLSYTISEVKRTDAATYRCNADNGIQPVDTKQTVLTVQYPPDVTVTTTNTTVNAPSAVLTCNADGVPKGPYSYDKWVQVWSGHENVSDTTGSERLELTNLTYEHSGVYTCSASNMVKVFGTDQQYMEGSVYLLVKSFPVITLPNGTSEMTASSKLGENATVEIEYYSNAGVPDVKCFRVLNGTTHIEHECVVVSVPTVVDLPVFAQTIKENGTKATISIRILSEEFFGLYNVTISNEINSTYLRLEIVAQGPPSPPYDIQIGDIQHTTVMLSWKRGFHGGFEQTFVIQLSRDKVKWDNITSVNGMLATSKEPISKTLDGLDDSTTYFVRMFAYNMEGNSNYTDYLNYTTLPIEITTTPVPVALIASPVGGGVIFILVIVVVVVMKRRGVLGKGKSKNRRAKMDRNSECDDDDDDDYGMQDNPMYDSSGPRDQENVAGGSAAEGSGPVYSTVDKTKPVVDNGNNSVYAIVDKSQKPKLMQDADNVYATPIKSKGKQEKKDKGKKGPFKDTRNGKTAKPGDIYENAPEFKAKNAMASPAKPNEETIYENPETSNPVQKKNKEGLIYADLEFNDQLKGQKKLVIHGLDDKTIYGEVDFTKRADPLPDSDDESSPPKN